MRLGWRGGQFWVLSQKFSDLLNDVKAIQGSAFEDLGTEVVGPPIDEAVLV